MSIKVENISEDLFLENTIHLEIFGLEHSGDSSCPPPPPTVLLYYGYGFQ